MPLKPNQVTINTCCWQQCNKFMQNEENLGEMTTKEVSNWCRKYQMSPLYLLWPTEKYQILSNFISNYLHTKDKHWIIILICSASTCFAFLFFFGCFLSLWSHVRHPPTPAFYPFVSVSRSFFPAHKALDIHVDMFSCKVAAVLFRVSGLPVVSRMQGGTLISTGSAVCTGRLSVLSNA